MLGLLFAFHYIPLSPLAFLSCVFLLTSSTYEVKSQIVLQPFAPHLLLRFRGIISSYFLQPYLNKIHLSTDPND